MSDKKPATTETVLTAEKKPGARFTKAQLLASQKYAGRRDVLEALLDGEKTYTAAEADAAIEKFMNGRVK